MTLIVALLLGAGLFFFLIGTLGLIRFPDALTRAHGAAKCDTLGALLCILGLMLQAGPGAAAFKLLLIVLFIWFTNPTATHVISRAILASSRQSQEEPPRC